MRKFLLILCSIILVNVLIMAQDTNQKEENIPSPLREMRGVWVATVDNIDWPSKPGLDTKTQQKEIIAILDKVESLNMNAVIFQVRPQADALYKSTLEPWSYYLSGEQGKAPNPYYDPLEFWIKEAHKRGIEVHAWFNPYRAAHPASKGSKAENSVLNTMPECVAKLGSQGYYWLIPTMEKVQDHSYNVVMEVVNNYDIDGIHFDDYFYPYEEYNDGKDFPDDKQYSEYKQNGGTLEKGDWRRDAVNKFIKRVYEGIKHTKPEVKFGISPFGFYRPGCPSIVTSTFDPYSTLYADSKLWLNNGWVDYFTPQLYWQISRPALSFPALLNWWNSENIKKRNLFPGLYFSPQIPTKDLSMEIINQVFVTRGMNTEAPGTILFSMKSMMNNDDTICKPLFNSAFTQKALMPTYTWIDDVLPEMPIVKINKGNADITVEINKPQNENPFLYVVYYKANNKWQYDIISSDITTYSIKDVNTTNIAVSCIDKCGNESKKNLIKIN